MYSGRNGNEIKRRKEGGKVRSEGDEKVGTSYLGTSGVAESFSDRTEGFGTNGTLPLTLTG